MDAWEEYLEKMREMEAQIKLTAFHAREAAEASRDAANYADAAVKRVRLSLVRRRVELDETTS